MKNNNQKILTVQTDYLKNYFNLKIYKNKTKVKTVEKNNSTITIKLGGDRMPEVEGIFVYSQINKDGHAKKDIKIRKLKPRVL